MLAILSRLVRAGLIEELMFRQRFEGLEGVRHLGEIWGKSF